jgi:uncharacterized protein
MMINIYKNTSVIAGPAGNLEIMIASPARVIVPAIGITCHPHPLYGGTMHNKVVTTLARTFDELGLWSVRFNFRGVGKSAGIHANGIGETEDLLAVMRWVREHFPEYKIWLAGFSFGAYVAMQGALREAAIVSQLITIAPAVNHIDFSDKAPIRCPWILVMGEADEIVPLEAVKHWVEKQPAITKSIYFPGVSHFFHGHLTQLREGLKALLLS